MTNFISCEGEIRFQPPFTFCSDDDGLVTVLSEQEISSRFVLEPISNNEAFLIGFSLWALFLVCWQGKKLLEMLRFF